MNLRTIPTNERSAFDVWRLMFGSAQRPCGDLSDDAMPGDACGGLNFKLQTTNAKL